MRKVAVLLQARTNSSRLPGKALLTLQGYPTVVLAAKRASNTGLPVTIVTSHAASDDALVRALEIHQVAYFRGSLNQPLARYVAATKDFSDDYVIVRLTGDNLLPDGALIDRMLDYFIKNQLNYLGSTAVKSGLPYGIHVELMRLEALREAFSNTNHPYDIEHVTPYIIRNYGFTCFPSHELVRTGHLRSTLDTLEDYLRLSELFKDIQDPISYDCLALAKHLPDPTKKFPKYSAVSKLILYAQRQDPDVIKLAKEKGVLHIDYNDQLQERANQVTITCPGELVDALENEAVNWIRMPFNLFDRRWEEVMPKIEIAKRLRVFTIEVYDVLLWNILLGEASEKTIEQIEIGVKDAHRESPLDLMLAYLRYFDWIDGIACPVASVGSLEALTHLFYKPALLMSEVEKIHSKQFIEEYGV